MKLIFLLLQISLTYGLGGVQLLCNGNFTPQTPLEDKLKFPDTYKITTVLTDWIKGSTESVTEIVSKDKNVTIIHDRNGVDSQYIYNEGKVLLVNKTDNTCSVQKELQPFQLPVSILQKLGATGYSISDLVTRIVEYSKINRGFLLSTQTMSGVEGAQWVTCVNGTQNETTTLQIEVVFAGEGSFKPVSEGFDNPLMLFFRLSEFNYSTSNATASNVFSFQIQSYSKVIDPKVFTSQLNTVCDGWPISALPLTFPEPFSGVVTYKSGDVVSLGKVYYAPSNDLTAVSVSGLKVNDQVPFFNTKSSGDDLMLMIHDFKTGYQYSLSSSKCISLAAIPTESADVVNGTTIAVRPLHENFVNISLPWGQYGKVTHLNGEEFDVWRAVEGDNLVEVHIGKRQWSFTKTKKASSTFVSSIEIIAAPIPPISISLARSSECFAGATSANNTFTFSIKGKSLENVLSIGESVVVSSLSKALAKVAPINPLRVSALFSSLPNGDLGVFLNVADKNTIAPSNTGKFNFTEEVATEILFDKLNSTFVAGDWQFDVATGDQKTEQWFARSASLSKYPLPPPPPQPAPYQGYTGGSMFVLGLFSLVLGCALGAGSLFFITKRQRISTLAYQVFE